MGRSQREKGKRWGREVAELMSRRRPTAGIMPAGLLLAAHDFAQPSEHQEQAAVVAWLEAHGEMVFAVPNGGRRNPREAASLKAEGVRPGVADLIIVRSPTLALEMKTRVGGRVSPAQAAWGQRVSAQGWVYHVAEGAQDAIAWLVGQGVGRG